MSPCVAMVTNIIVALLTTGPSHYIVQVLQLLTDFNVLPYRVAEKYSGGLMFSSSGKSLS